MTHWARLTDRPVPLQRQHACQPAADRSSPGQHPRRIENRQAPQGEEKLILKRGRKGHHGRKGRSLRSWASVPSLPAHAFQAAQQAQAKPPLDPNLKHLFEYIEAMEHQEDPHVRLVYANLVGNSDLIRTYETFRDSDAQQQARSLEAKEALDRLMLESEAPAPSLPPGTHNEQTRNVINALEGNCTEQHWAEPNTFDQPPGARQTGSVANNQALPTFEPAFYLDDRQRHDPYTLGLIASTDWKAARATKWQRITARFRRAVHTAWKEAQRPSHSHSLAKITTGGSPQPPCQEPSIGDVKVGDL